MTEWSKDEVWILRTMASEGRTTADIAEAINRAFGTDRTRNAVIGYANRHEIKLGLAPRRSEPPPPPKRKPAKAAKPKTGKQMSARNKARDATKEKAVNAKIADILQFDTLKPEGVQIVDATSRQCKWPVPGRGAEGLMLCCAAPTVIGKAYCLHHYAKYLAPEVRERGVRAALRLGAYAAEAA